ncbi:TldD/PmbA family protein [soil metagenome]
MSRPSGPDAPEGLVIAERAVAMALDAGASQAEALVVRTTAALTRFANNEIHQNVAEDDASVNLRFVLGQRAGVASGNELDDVALRRLCEAAAAATRVQPEDSGFASLPGPGTPATVAGAWSDRTAEASPEQRAVAVAAIVAAAEAEGVVAFGLCRTAAEEVSVANSLGIRASEPRSSAQLLTVMMGPAGGSGYAERVAVDVDTLDASEVGHEAAARARESAEPIELPPGDYPVVLLEYAVVDLADMLGWLGFSALAVQEERSFFEPGRRIGSPLVTLTDDAADPAGTPASFDYEGVAKQRVPLVDAGVCRAVVHDAQTASREGRTSTGHGLPAPNPWGPFPLNMVMAAGDTSRADLIGGLERGMLVTRFHYTNVVHPKQAIITGMTRDGLFLVEAGRIGRPVRNLRFTQSYLEALAGVEAVSRERRTLEGFLGTAVVPAVRIGSFSFTGTTEH